MSAVFKQAFIEVLNWKASYLVRVEQERSTRNCTETNTDSKEWNVLLHSWVRESCKTWKVYIPTQRLAFVQVCSKKGLKQLISTEMGKVYLYEEESNRAQGADGL